METFVQIPSIYPKLLELRQSKTAEFKKNKYLKDTTKLRYYQVIGALHMLLLERMVLGDGVGLGKTIELIAAYTFLLEQDPTLKLIVVCPKSAMFQWQEEFEKFTQGISTRVITNEYKGLIGANARKLQYQEFKENIFIINYALLRQEYEIIRDILGSNFIVCYDEIQAFKNRKTETHFSCKYLAERARRAYGLSATIIKNGLEEVYCIYDVIVPGLFGKITKFKDTYCKQKLMKLYINGRERYIPKIIGYKNLPQFKKTIDPYFLIRRKEEVATELPQLISKKIILEMLPDQKDLYKQALVGIIYEEKIKQEYFEIADKVRNQTQFGLPVEQTVDEKILKIYKERKEKYDKFLTFEGKKRGKLAALTYCQMISNGPRLLQDNKDSSKEEEFQRLLMEELLVEKTIVFTRFKKSIPYLEIICERNGIKFTRITGDETSRERDKARLLFQSDPDCKVLFITTAGSEALNLQAASVVLFYDTPWSYGDLVQTIGRAQRIGSIQEHILILHLVNKGTIDMRVMTRVTDKKELSDAVIGDTAVGALDFTANEDRVIDDLYADLLKDAETL
jgi:SNF2 family DNA or RNA helicase